MQNQNEIIMGNELVHLDEHSWNNITPHQNQSLKINFDTYANPPNDLQMQRAQSCLNPPKELQLCRLNSDNHLQNPLKHEEMQVLLKLYNMGFSPFHITYLTQKHNMSLTIPNFMNIIIDLIAMDERYQDVINAGPSKNQSKSSYQFNINEEADDWVDIIVDQQKEVVQQTSEIKITVPIQAAQLENPCPICLVSEADSRYLQCDHEFCSDCYKSYISDAIKRSCTEIGCPQEGCIVKFTEEQLKEHTTTNLFMQYQRFKQYKMVDENPNLKWCPKPGCELYVTRTANDIAECICGQLVCFKCGNVAHEGLECDDAIQRDFQGALKEFKIQHCPQCKSHIQKISGCNHMTCYKCKYQFCWICLQKYHNYHYRYWSMQGCAIWSSGRYKQLNSNYDPDTLRNIFLFPRILIFLLRAPLILIKLLAKASFKAIRIPCKAGSKRVKRIKINNKCLKYLIKFLLFWLVLLFSLVVFPIILLFYTGPVQIKMLTIKGCAF